jgi:Tol biopolymer transport system component
MGATPTKISLYSGPQWPSHDGKNIAFFQYDIQKGEDRLIVANADGSNEQIIATRKWPERFGWNWDARPAWSKDDQTLTGVLVQATEPTFNIKLYDIHLPNRSQQIVTLTGKTFELLEGVSLLEDASGVMATAKAQGASFFQVWQLLRDGTAQQITNDLSDYVGMSLTSDSSSLVTVQRQVLSNIVAAPKTDPFHPSSITSGAGRYFDLCWSPDGKILYASDASGSANIYEIDPQTMTNRALTDAGRNYAPAVSPDGHHIAFHSNRSGAFQIWIADRDGNNPRQLTFGEESNWPQFTADGNWIVYQHSERNTTAVIWKVPVSGGTPSPLTNQVAMRPTISPDGNWIACWASEAGENARWRLGILPSTGNGSPKYFDVTPTVGVNWNVLIRWSADSKSVTYIDRRGGFDNVWLQPIDGSPAKQLTDFKDSRIFSFDWSRDGRLLASRGVETNDVVLISDSK